MEPEVSLTIGATFFLALNVLYCCVQTRRVNMLERRIRAIEEKEPPQAASAAPQPIVSQLQPTYYPPTNYTFYQTQPLATAPTATPYYPQDPQVLQVGRGY